MTETDAEEVARAYAIDHDVPWVGVAKVRKTRGLWWFKVLEYHFEIDTGGQGTAAATVNTLERRVIWFEFRPTDPGRFWLPPWSAYPLYDAVTIGWRMGYGQRYGNDWHRWFAGLLEDRRAAYRERFPEPDREAWPGFYELASQWPPE